MLDSTNPALTVYAPGGNRTSHVTTKTMSKLMVTGLTPGDIAGCAVVHVTMAIGLASL